MFFDQVRQFAMWMHLSHCPAAWLIVDGGVLLPSVRGDQSGAVFFAVSL